jgi:hypothetical protein
LGYFKILKQVCPKIIPVFSHLSDFIRFRDKLTELQQEISLCSKGSSDAGEPPGILQEVIISINMIIYGCNFDKKLIFFKKKVTTPVK